MGAGDRQSNTPGVVIIQVVDGATNLTIGNGASYFTIPPHLNGFDLTEVHARVVTAAVGSAVTLQIAKNGTDLLSTLLTIDATEVGSDTALVPAVIDTLVNTVSTNDLIRIDIDGVGSGTPAQGLIIRMTFGD